MKTFIFFFFTLPFVLLFTNVYAGDVTDRISKDKACVYADGFSTGNIDIKWNIKGQTILSYGFVKNKKTLYYSFSAVSYSPNKEGDPSNINFHGEYFAAYSCEAHTIKIFQLNPRQFLNNSKITKGKYLHIKGLIPSSDYLVMTASYGSETLLEGIFDIKTMKMYYFSQFPEIALKKTQYCGDFGCGFFGKFEYFNGKLYGFTISSNNMEVPQKYQIDLKNKKIILQK